MEVSVGRYLYFTSFFDKASGVEFVDPKQPAPVVNVDNNWMLIARSPSNIWQVRPLENENGQGVEIEMFSNYLENAFHVFVRLTMTDEAELHLDLTVEHQFEEGLNDSFFSPQSALTSGLTFLAFMKPPDAGKHLHHL